MLSTINETYLFQQDLLTVKMFPSIQQMGKCAATEVTNKICELLKEKAEINMIFAAAPSQNEFLSHLIHSKQIDWTRINAFHMDEYTGNSMRKLHRVSEIFSGSVSSTKSRSRL